MSNLRSQVLAGLRSIAEAHFPNYPDDHAAIADQWLNAILLDGPIFGYGLSKKKILSKLKKVLKIDDEKEFLDILCVSSIDSKAERQFIFIDLFAGI